MAAPRAAPCPQCGGVARLAADNRFRPFCSERCKLLDLGEWLSGRYTIPATEAEGDADPAQDEERLQ